jgi:DNA-binding NarL/FixJ family response regulator
LRSVQAFNSYELTGSLSRSAGQGLDDLVLEHLTVQRELKKLSAHEEMVLRMLAEDYGNAEIAAEMGVAVKTVIRLRRGLAQSLERP